MAGILPNDMLEMAGKGGTLTSRDISILLHERYSRDQLYTRVGLTSVLAVNPHKRVFSPAHSEYDLARICGDASGSEPHPFDVASAAYLHMTRALEDQVILTCGESGSGKTEILRQVLQQIVYLSQQTDPQTKIHTDILSTELVLECFGNAETVQNKNSTRYSRYTELRFNEEGTVVGCKITDYLFESSRVPKCPEHDHNFHVFYMMLASGSKDDVKKWMLHSQDTKSYHYLHGDKSQSPDLPKIETLKASLKELGFSRRQVNDIFLTLAGILHLGNIEFTMEDQGKGYGAYVKNHTELEAAAKLFSVSPDPLEVAITTASYVEDDVVCSAFLDVNKSKEARDSLADVIYRLVFKWIIEQINTNLGSSRIGGCFVSQIGLLDIAGFEDRTPNPNGFDQFMSNYANEKLQNFVLARAINFIPFAVAADGVFTQGYSAPLPVDSSIIDFYDMPSKGLFELIDKETYLHGFKARDSTVLAGFEITHGGGKHPLYDSGTGGWSTFQIKHYMGKSVSYNINGFVNKNRNSCFTDVIHLFGVTANSTSGKQKAKSFIAGLFTESVIRAVVHPKDGKTIVSAIPAAPQGPSQASEGSRKKSSSMIISSSIPLKSTASVKIAGLDTPTKSKQSPENTTTSALSVLRTSIDTLIQAMNEMRSWTIVCVNPNDEMASDRFKFDKVVGQVCAYRVNEIAQAAKVEYTVGMEFVDFMDRFGKLNADISVADVSDEQKCMQFVAAENWSSEEGKCGNTRVFLAEMIWRNLESRIDRLAKDMDESEGRRIHLISDSRGIQRTPGFIQKSMASLANLEEKPGKEDEPAPDIKKSKMSLFKSKASLAKAKEEEEEEEPEPKEPEAPKPPPPVERMSRSRYQWVCFTWFATWWIPDIALEKIGKMTQPSVKMAWREKFALCFIVCLLSAVMLFFVQGLGKLLCPIQSYFSTTELMAHTADSGNDLFVSMNGYIFDVTGFKHPGTAIQDSAGGDVSGYFPRYDPTTNVPFSSACSWLTPTTSNPQTGFFLEKRDNAVAPVYTIYSNYTNSYCTEPTLPNDAGYCHDTVTITKQISLHKMGTVAQVGVLAFLPKQVSMHNTQEDWWTSINGKIYNISILSSSASIYTFDPTLFSFDLLGLPGQDASKNATKMASAIACFDQFLLIGFIDNRVSESQCAASGYVLYGVTGVMVAVMVVKFLAALQLAPSPNPEGCDRFVIMQVPCYNEGEQSLVKTIESLAVFDYDDTRKLLFIVSDGMIKSAGSDMSTADIVLQILGVDKNVQKPESKSYLAIGKGLKEHNKAKVYSGLYSIQARYIPFIFIMKVGKENETQKPGNRGKRDSQMILMKFLNRVHFGTPMSPLELEMYHHIKNIIGVDPFLYEYCLMVDADTRVEPQSLNRLISCMVNDANTMGICGETKIENENESWVTMMQVYEYYISHHMAKAFESLFGSVTCLPGCFCMYRLRTPKKAPLLISNQILNEYKDINVNTLHKQNLLSLGEDRFLTTLMLKHFPEYRNKFTPDALCYTIVPDTFNMLLGQRRRWINSTIHNLFELIFLPTLCGCLCFSLRLVVFLDLFATLIMPASTAYLVYLIYSSVQSNTAPMISLIMMASAYGLQAIIFLFKGQYQHIGWLVISILAMPCFSFYIPLYAYWHFDDFKWGNTRKGASADTGAGHGSGTDDEEFTPLEIGTVPLLTWETYEASTILKNPHALESNSLNTVGGNSLERVCVVDANAAVDSNTKGVGGGVGLVVRKVGDVGAGSAEYTTTAMSVVQVPNAIETCGFVNDPWRGGIPRDEEIVEYVRHVITSTDLSQLSKKKVREAVAEYFGCDLSAKKAFINDTVEAILQG